MAIQYFDWFNLLVNDIAGNIWIFNIIVAALIFGVGSYCKMNWKVSLLLFVSFTAIFNLWIGEYFVFIVFLAAVILGLAIRKIAHQ